MYIPDNIVKVAPNVHSVTPVKWNLRSASNYGRIYDSINVA